jgi:hypothetical protein
MNGVGPRDRLSVLLPGYRLWAVVLELVIGDVHLVTRLVTVLEVCRGVPAGQLLCFVRQVRVNWQTLALLPGQPRSTRHYGAVARELIAEQIDLGYNRGPLVPNQPR